MILRALCLLVLLPLPALGQDLPFPAPAEVTADRAEPLGSYALPVGRWADGELPVRRAEGAVRQTAWRVAAEGMATLAVLTPLRAALVEDGFEILFECETATCGGFDFRFATEILPAPAMNVDLGDFRFAAFARGGEVASLLVSRGGASAYVQLTRVAPAEQPAIPAESFTAEPPPDAAPADQAPDEAEALAATGAVILEDLTFASGSADLGNGAFDSLDRLAAYLRANPGHRVTVVGHTDAVGGLDGNIALSQRRAASVVERLVAVYGVPRAQLSAAGAGFLAPRATNLTEEGRALNRRVEVVLTAME